MSNPRIVLFLGSKGTAEKTRYRLKTVADPDTLYLPWRQLIAEAGGD